jgi:hemerythrin
MTIAHWQDTYCTGNARIDREHQTLFAMVNALHEAIEDSAPQFLLNDRLTAIAVHTIEHFQHEEALMVDYNYPGYSRHKQIHDNLLLKVNHLLQQFNENKTVLNADLTSFLTEWLSHHIQGEDQNMIHFLRAQPALELSSQG